MQRTARLIAFIALEIVFVATIVVTSGSNYGIMIFMRLCAGSLAVGLLVYFAITGLFKRNRRAAYFHRPSE